jgi:hypothetical protein
MQHTHQEQNEVTNEGLPIEVVGHVTSLPSLDQYISFRHSEPTYQEESPEEPIALSWVWNVTSLHPVPLDVPIERTAMKLKKVPVDVISSRISCFMKMNSIACSYQTNVGRVSCLTEGCLKFVIQLWQGSPMDESIIVEVQRRQGCAIAMQQLRKRLYGAITSNTDPCGSLQERANRRPSATLQKCILQEALLAEPPENVAICLCLDLLESELVDQNRLGMESLSHLTDPNETSSGNVEVVARSLVYRDGNHGNRLQDAFAPHILCHTERLEGDHGLEECNELNDSTSSIEYLDDPVSIEYSQGCQFGAIHLLALKVLANSLEVIACHEEDYLSNETTMLNLPCLFWSDILNALAYNLKMPSYRPQEAALSAKCIRLLKSLEPDSIWCILDETITTWAVAAYEFGRAHHLALERESLELLRHLQVANPPVI